MDKLQLVNELYKPFEIDEHEIRVGSTKNKAQWFVYVRREAITERLDKLCPLDWTDEIIRLEQKQNFATAVMRLTIGGISRENNGSQSGNGENSEKGAVTDAFKRVASSFGLGLYLQSIPPLWTNGGFVTKGDDGKWRTDYKEQNRQEKEAFGKFANWYRGQFGGEQKRPPPPQEQTEDAGRPAVWSATFTHMAYVVRDDGQRYVGFANCMPSSNGSNPNQVIVRAYGRSKELKAMIGGYAYDENNLARYDGAELSTQFVKMPLPIEFEYVEKTTKGGYSYLEVCGIVGGDNEY